MPRDDLQFTAAKRAYRNASEEGNRHEEARWANVIGDILKNRGEYVEALKWLRVDYEVSVKYLPEKQLLPTCQSLGEVYLRLEYFKDALIYQKKHLQLAKESDDLIEQQRASTQLGRTYHEMFIRSTDDHYSFRNAKKYFKAAMKLAQTLKENPPSNRSSFLNEFIDAHNNIGMLEMDLDNFKEAERILTKGLEICDEEEVIEDNDMRSRLHHNLGNVYMELRMWERARDHIEKDIIICKRIGHCQGEAKGYINLGELHYKVQKYEEANLCYKKALDLAQSMDDEDALASQIDQNIETVKEAMKVMDELKKEEQNLKKLSRQMVMARATPGERKCLLQQNVSLDRLIEKSSMIFAWMKHREFAKRKKRIAIELCDKEKLSDSYLVIGESYQKLRNFDKALKWCRKGWETYKSIGNLEGQALVKINIGDVLDSVGDWTGALNAFEDGYRLAVEANLPSVQISALENMHYSHMIRFDNIEQGRRIQDLIDDLKQPKSRVLDAHNKAEDCCSETDTEGDDSLSNGRSNESSLAVRSKPISSRPEPLIDMEELKDDEPLISLLRPSKSFTKLRTDDLQEHNVSSSKICASSESLSKSTCHQQTVVGRKRVRVILSDDEGEMHEVAERSKQKVTERQVEDVATLSECRCKHDAASLPHEFEDVSAAASKGVASSCNPVILEESTCSYKSNSSNVSAQDRKYSKSSSINEVIYSSNLAASVSNYAENLLQTLGGAGIKLHSSGDESDHTVTFKIDNELIHMEIGLSMVGGNLSAESLKVDLACLYYLQLPLEKRRKGLLPILQHMVCQGRTLVSPEAIDALKDPAGKGWVDVVVDGWVQKPLMKLYIDCCENLSEAPNLKLLKKLYNLEISEDEVIVSECELQDLSIAPLLDALHAHKTVSMIDLSHNLLGNGTMEKLKQVIISSGQNYGGLSLDLHCNRFGPTALFQICECPVLFARLEVLNISGNRLTDACGSYLSTILENCKALYSLNIERCSLTSRTIQKVADSMDPGCVLAQLWLGYNNPVSANAIVNLLDKLAALKRFSELNLNGLKLGKPVVESLCQLLKTPCLSALMLGGTNIGNDSAIQLTESFFSGIHDLAKLDLSYCGLTSQYIVKLNSDFPMAGGLTELDLGGNPIMQEGATALASILMNPQCCVKVLILNHCHLGLSGVLRILQALAANNSLEELHLVENADLQKHSSTSQCVITKGQNPEMIEPTLNPLEASSNAPCVVEKVNPTQQDLCTVNTDYNQLQVADSEDELIGDSCTSSCQRDLSFREHRFVEELSTAIGMATALTLLDLSSNGLSFQVAETLYDAWSLNSRAGLSQKHIKDEIVHFSVGGVERCKVRPCCRRD